jgi:biopolymer transport protein TolR
MAMSTGEIKGTIADMNVVPLIDILLVLLIIFMVISPAVPQGLQAAIPQENKISSPPAQGTVVVQVSPGGKIKINNETTDFKELGPRMEAIFKNRLDKVAFVKGDDNVLFQDIARTIDILRGSGIDKVGLITGQV